MPGSFWAETRKRGGRAAFDAELAAHRDAAGVGAGDHVRGAAEIGRDPGAREEADHGPGPARRVGFAAPQAGEDRVAGILLGEDDGMAAGIREEMVLDVAMAGVAAAEMAGVVVLFGGARGSRYACRCSR